MKKFIITEEEKARILNMHKSKSYLMEEMDPQSPKNHFTTVENALIQKGFKKDDSMLKDMGVIDLKKLKDGDEHMGIIVRYYSPSHNQNKGKKKVVVDLIVDNKLKMSWDQGANMEDVINKVENYI